MKKPSHRVTFVPESQQPYPTIDFSTENNAAKVSVSLELKDHMHRWDGPRLNQAVNDFLTSVEQCLVAPNGGAE